MSHPKKSVEGKDPTIVDVIHEWLGQSGLRKIWGMETTPYFSYLFLRENDRRYFIIGANHVADAGKHDDSVDIADPQFFEKLRVMLDNRERSRTIVCRCKTCEGGK